MSRLIEDVLILAIVVGLGGWGFSSWRAARAGRITPPRCWSCGRLVSRADRSCRHCGLALPEV